MNERLRRLFESRFRIATQLYVGIGGAVVLTVGASLVAWFSFNIVGQAQSLVNEESLPEMEAAFGVAQHSGTLVDAAPRLMAATNIEDLAKVSRSVDDARDDLEANLAVLLGSESVGESDQSASIPVPKDVLGQVEGEGQDIEVGRSARIRESVDMLIVNINAIRDDMTGLYELNKRRDDLRRDLEQLREKMDEIMVPVVDDQLFYTMTGYQSLDAPPVSREQHFSEDQLARYRNLAGLHADVAVLTVDHAHHDCQPQPLAFDRAVRIDPAKQFENPVMILFGDSNAVIPDLVDGIIAVDSPANT